MVCVPRRLTVILEMRPSLLFQGGQTAAETQDSRSRVQQKTRHCIYLQVKFAVYQGKKNNSEYYARDELMLIQQALIWCMVYTDSGLCIQVWDTLPRFRVCHETICGWLPSPSVLISIKLFFFLHQNETGQLKLADYNFRTLVSNSVLNSHCRATAGRQSCCRSINPSPPPQRS